MIATTLRDDGGPLPRVAVATVPSLLLRRVTLSGVFVLALVLLWAAVLLPSLLRRHDVALARSAERLSSAVRVLQRPPRRPSPGPGPGASARPVDLPERVDASGAAAVGGRPGPGPAHAAPPPDRAPAVDPAPAGDPTGEPVRSPAPRPVPALTPAARAARRRGRVLAVLLLVTAAGAAAGVVLGTAGWVVAGVGGVALGLFLAAAWWAVRTRDVPASARRPSGVALDRPALDRAEVERTSGQPAPPQLFDQELVAAVADDADRSERVAAHTVWPPDAIAPVAAAEPETAPGTPVREPEEAPVIPAPRRRRPLVGADGTWTPIPVPTPTYLTAPRVPYPSTPRRPLPAGRPARQPQVARQRPAAAFGVRRAVGS